MSETAKKNGHELTAAQLAVLCARGQHKGTVTDRAGRKSCVICSTELCVRCESSCLSHSRHGSRCNSCGHVNVSNPPQLAPGAPIHAVRPSVSDNVVRAREYPSTAFVTDGRSV